MESGSWCKTDMTGTRYDSYVVFGYGNERCANVKMGESVRIGISGLSSGWEGGYKYFPKSYKVPEKIKCGGGIVNAYCSSYL